MGAILLPLTKKAPKGLQKILVETTGIEPATSALRTPRSPS